MINAYLLAVPLRMAEPPRTIRVPCVVMEIKRPRLGPTTLSVSVDGDPRVDVEPSAIRTLEGADVTDLVVERWLASLPGGGA